MKNTAYLFQALLIISWWLALLNYKVVFDAFQFPNIEKTAFYSFFLPDLIMIAILSILRAYRELKSLEWIILGAFGYATLYCINASILSNGGYLSSLLMLFGFAVNLFLSNQSIFFKTATSSSKSYNALKTICQITIVWILALLLIPMLIEYSLGNNILPNIHPQFFIGLGLFVLFSVLGIRSAYEFVSKGDGTPLPIDQTSKLVITGPYRFVRNPMAIAGVGQTISVAVAYNSLAILVYALTGALIWNFVIRKVEERDMSIRFGTSYTEYTEKIKCWIPKFR